MVRLVYINPGVVTCELLCTCVSKCMLKNQTKIFVKCCIIFTKLTFFGPLGRVQFSFKSSKILSSQSALTGNVACLIKSG